MKKLPAKIHKPIDCPEDVIDRFAIAEIASELKQRLDIHNMDMDADILLEQIIILTIRMYLSKDTRSMVVQ